MKINLFKTRPHPCSYIDGEEASTVFVDPDTPMDATLYSILSRRGYRRSGAHVYRPHCRACTQCIATRVPVAEHSPNRNQRRSLSRNRDLTIEILDDIDNDTLYGIYQRYIDERHSDGDMYPADRQQYREFLSSEWRCTRYAVFSIDATPIGVTVFDHLDDGLSAIYTFFEPSEGRRSIGTFAVLWLIEHARDLGLDFVYLGYWIRDCAKMRYKSRYRPIELLIDDSWVRAN